MKIVNSHTIDGNSSEFPLLFQSEYAKFWEDETGKYAIVANDNESIFMPYLLVKSQFLRIVTIICPPISKSGVLTSEIESDFINQVILFFRINNICDRISYPMHFGVFRTYPKGADAIDFGIIAVSLENKSERELYSAFKSNYRNEINRCIKEEVEVKFGDDQLPAFNELYKANMIREHQVVDNVQGFYTNFAGGKSIVCAMAYHNGIPQGGAIIPFSRSGAYYLYGCSSPNPALSGALKYLQWEIIKFLMAKDVKKYYLGGARLNANKKSKYEGIKRFKMGFGSEIEEGILWKLDLKKVKCGLYDVLYFFKYKVLKRS